MLKSIEKLSKYIDQFGFQAIPFLLKRYFKSSTLIEFHHHKLLHPIFLRNGTSDVAVFNQIFLYEGYKIDFGFEPEVIVDLGANIGLSAVYFKNKYPNSRIVCIEPELSNFNLLQKNVELYENITCLNAAIWCENKNLAVNDQGLGHWGYMVQETTSKSNELIKAYSIDQLMHEMGLSRIDVLKIDIEGSEKELFEKNYRNWLCKVRAIIIELHDHLRKGASMSFFKALTEHDFCISRKEENLIVKLK